MTSDIPNKDDLEQLRQALILKQNEGLGSYNQKLEELQKEFKNLENGMELAVKKTIKEINSSDDERAVYENIYTKITENSTKIQAFEDKIDLKANRDEITQTLNSQLEPLKNDIKQQASQIELLPDRLTETVSNKIYETTISGLVQRLEAEEAKRETLANQINDTVSIQQYQAGIQEAKEYADEQLEDVANNPEIKAGIQKANEEAQESLKEYVRAQDELRAQEAQAYADGKVSEEEQRAIQDAQAKLEEAKQNAELKARNAEKKANAYTDGKVKESTDAQRKTLARYGSQIIQNGKDIKLRTTKEEFDATNRTLSNILSEIVQNITDGTTIRYDDNGVAQSLNVGPQGIQLNGDKINLNASRQFNLLVSDMRNKVDKNSVVSSINASPERIDINTQNIGIRGGSGQSYVDIRNDQIELGGGFRRTWRGRSTRHNIFTRLKDGHLRFRNNALDRSLYMSEFGISTYIDGEGEGLGSSGTIQWWDTTYSESDANGITINSYGGVVALSSDNNRIVLDAYASSNVESKTAAVYIHPHKETRPGNNRFAFTVSNADHSSNTDGYIMYGSDTNYNYGAGLRFSKSQNGKTVQVVDGNYSTGGDTTIEAGYGSFNTISKRDGNKYVRIISDDGFLVGRDNAGNRIASKIYL
ncbi:phage minor structural protein [Staphylococcus schleiferi]|uniref:Phage minor structural protein n=1 Tax=Staphylococcus schleiferi TaxID=1295 RepID=A0A7Z7VXA1_STASC|nr:phage minor structural protein [Staphylococcus schleiferi]SUM89074.1 phage minor structural protein [Staphylococcus schleiferi]